MGPPFPSALFPLSPFLLSTVYRLLLGTNRRSLELRTGHEITATGADHFAPPRLESLRTDRTELSWELAVRCRRSWSESGTIGGKFMYLSSGSPEGRGFSPAATPPIESGLQPLKRRGLRA